MKKVVAEGGEELSKRLKRLIEDEERTMAKLEELQTHLKEVRIARKQEDCAQYPYHETGSEGFDGASLRYPERQHIH